MRLRRSGLRFAALVGISVLCSVVPYVRLYFGRHNSLWDDAAYLVLLSSLTLLYLRSFRSFVLSKRNPLNPLAVAVGILLLVDLLVNTPLNVYKTKMYMLLSAMYILCFLFTKLGERQKQRFVGYLLLTWLTVSVVELYLRWTQPLLFDLLPWPLMTLQSALRPLVAAGQLTVVQSKVYGLGIGSQANVIALLSMLLFVSMGGFTALPKIFRIRFVKVLAFCGAVAILPFALSLTSVIAFACAISVVILKRAARFTTSATFGLSLVAAGILGIFAFRIGDVFGFAATSASRATYMREFIYWPLEYLDQHSIPVLLGLHNDITAAPLENRYFNFLLTLGAPLSLAIAIALFRIFRTLMRRSSQERHGTLKLMLFVLFAVSYAHIGFTAHLPGLVLLASMVVFITERSSRTASAESTAPSTRPAEDSQGGLEPGPWRLAPDA